MVNAQEWLDKNYSYYGKRQRKGRKGNINNHQGYGKKKSKITELNIYGKNLVGELKLVEFSNLTLLYCSSNKLTSLDLNACSNLTELCCSNNNLTDLTFLTTLNSNKLTILSIDSNNFLTSDLTVLSQFINLERLTIGNDKEEKISHGIHNRFYGSLEPLQTLTKLKYLDIVNTDINSGLEYLPDTLTKFYCSTKYRPTALSQQLINQLIVYGKSDGINYAHLLTVWKKNYLPWKQHGFTGQEKEQWINTGLLVSEYKFATYLKQQGHNPLRLFTDLEELKKEFKEWLKIAQNYLDIYYPLQTRKELTQLDISNKKLEGELNLSDFINLKNLNCQGNQLISLDVSNCQELTTLDCSNNQLTTLLLPNKGENLTELNINDNQLSDLVIFNCLVNKKLRKLDLTTNKFVGSLEPLKNLSGLTEIDIHNTDIDSGLEYLPESVNRVSCATGKKSVGCQKIAKMLKVYSYNPQEWKEKFFLKQQQLELQKQLDLLQSQLNTNSIEYLQVRIEELTNSIKQQKDKIVDAYLYFCSEKELLRRLINTYLEFLNFKKQGTNSPNYYDKCEEYEDKCKEMKRQLRTKLSRENMNEVQAILNDCEELVNWNFELETKRTEKKLLLEGNNLSKFNTVSHINIDKLIIDKGHAIFGRLGDDSNLIHDTNNFSGNFTSRGTMVNGSQQFRDNTSFNTNIPVGSKRLRRDSLEENPSTKKTKNNWVNIHSNFTNQKLIEKWLNNNFTYEQTKEWIDIGLSSHDAGFYAWIRDIKKKDAEWVLNYGSEVQLRNEYQQWQQLETRIEVLS